VTFADGVVPLEKVAEALFSDITSSAAGKRRDFCRRRCAIGKKSPRRTFGYEFFVLALTSAPGARPRSSLGSGTQSLDPLTLRDQVAARYPNASIAYVPLRVGALPAG
jgi:hypothetical protein